MGRVISLCNQKGGVGKTTTAINLSANLAASGLRILLIDLDPQANATSGLGLDKRDGTRPSTYQVLLEGVQASSAVVSSRVPGLFLVPSHVGLSGAEVELVNLPEREYRLKSALASVRSEYDLLLIDCPPSLGLLTVNALSASDEVLIPLQCEYYALEGLSSLLDTIRAAQGGLNPQLEISGVLLTMADFRTKLTDDVIREVRAFFGKRAFETVIPRSVRLSEAPSRGLPVGLYDSASSGAKAYQALAEEFLFRRKMKAENPAEVSLRESESGDDNLEVVDGGNTRTGQRNSGSDSGGPAPEGADWTASGQGSRSDPTESDSGESLSTS